MWMVLAALGALGVSGYVYLKPVREAAKVASSTVDAVKGQTDGLSQSLSGVAQSFLPPGAFALYSHIASQEGGVTGFLSNLQNKDLQSVIDEVKKVGGDDAKRIIEKVEKKLQAAKGDVKKMDWKSLVEELKSELPASQQKLVDNFVGMVPTKEDFDQYVNKAKSVGQDSLKEIETQSKKVLERVEKARKDGKSQADAFIAGLKDASPADVDSLISQLKETAKKAGLPADAAESWLRNKAEAGKVDAEDLAKQLQGRLQTVARFLPGQPKDLVNQVSQISPSLGQLLLQAMQQAEISDEKGNKK